MIHLLDNEELNYVGGANRQCNQFLSTKEAYERNLLRRAANTVAKYAMISGAVLLGIKLLLDGASDALSEVPVFGNLIDSDVMRMSAVVPCSLIAGGLGLNITSNYLCDYLTGFRAARAELRNS